MPRYLQSVVIRVGDPCRPGHSDQDRTLTSAPLRAVASHSSTSPGAKDGPSPPAAWSRCYWQYCRRWFRRPVELAAHVTTAHLRGDLQYPVTCAWQSCWRASRPMYDRDSIQAHLHLHTGYRPYQCPSPGCDKTFLLSQTVKIHLRSHASDGPSDRKTKEGADKSEASVQQGNKWHEVNNCQRPVVSFRIPKATEYRRWQRLRHQPEASQGPKSSQPSPTWNRRLATNGQMADHATPGTLGIERSHERRPERNRRTHLAGSASGEDDNHPAACDSAATVAPPHSDGHFNQPTKKPLVTTDRRARPN